jgi:outer membrane protein assembly factor BamB
LGEANEMKGKITGMLAGLALFGLVLSGCATMADGVAAISGHGGEIARADAMPVVKDLARELAPQQPRPVWQRLLPQEAADFAVFVDTDRLLVGTVESGAYLGVPDFREIVLYDAKSGGEIWRAERPKIRNGFYSVLATAPVLILEGRGTDSSLLLAYDMQTGKKLWERKQSDVFKASVTENALLVAVFEPGQWSVASLDLESGAPLWSRVVATAKSDKTPCEVFFAGKDLVLVSEKIHTLHVDSGVAGWSARLPWDNFNYLSISERADGYLVAGAEGAALYERASGKLLWSRDSGKSPIRLISFGGDNLYLVHIRGALLGKSLAGVEGQTEIECIDLKKRRNLWRYSLGSEIVSPLVQQGGTLFFATTELFIGLKAKNGRKLFARQLAKDVAAGSPKNASQMGQPDIINVRRDKIFLARERYGILAFSLPEGKFLWAQPHYLSPLNNFYTADHQYAVFIASLKKYRHLDEKAAMPAASGSTAYRQSVILQVMQRSADNAIARADATRKSPGTTHLGGQIASTGKVVAIESKIVADRMEQNRRAMQATLDLLNAAIDFNVALAKALKKTAEEGLFERLSMQGRGSVMAWQGAFQGRYYLWPFQERGRGLTLIDLDSGQREDLIYAPMVMPLVDFSVDLPTFALSPSQDRLVAFGVPLDQSIYREYVKWKWRIPQPAALSYALEGMPFDRESRTLLYWNENLKTDMVEWAFRGDVAKIRELIGNGVSVNQHKYGVTPLLSAIANSQTEAVRVLVENHADVNLANENGVKPLALAKAVAAPESIITLLKRAGAK